MAPPKPLVTLGGQGEVTAQEAAQVVVENYSIYHETSQRLVALQKWISDILESQK